MFTLSNSITSKFKKKKEFKTFLYFWLHAVTTISNLNQTLSWDLVNSSYLILIDKVSNSPNIITHVRELHDKYGTFDLIAFKSEIWFKQKNVHFAFNNNNIQYNMVGNACKMFVYLFFIST